ncbi:MAG: hypothetical protein NVSMB43_06260 [Pseudarthrobacter sp.]
MDSVSFRIRPLISRKREATACRSGSVNGRRAARWKRHNSAGSPAPAGMSGSQAGQTLPRHNWNVSLHQAVVCASPFASIVRAPVLEFA